ncbi:hypothetical protein ACH5RR_029450 [Cinchona calisaya]|uniref:Uncharacterized protein n=1 Tax=Cinchona calisaya TaxID=153742 RepID=A0ABD2YTA0_9GENT
MILGRHFLLTDHALIDVNKGKLILRVENESIEFDVFEYNDNIPIVEEKCANQSLNSILVRSNEEQNEVNQGNSLKQVLKIKENLRNELKEKPPNKGCVLTKDEESFAKNKQNGDVKKSRRHKKKRKWFEKQLEMLIEAITMSTARKKGLVHGKPKNEALITKKKGNKLFLWKPKGKGGSIILNYLE